MKIPVHQRTSDNDIVFLGNYITTVRQIDQYLRLQKKYQTSTTFETEEDYQKLAKIYKDEDLADAADKMRRAHKFNFWPEAGKLKLSTVHSFKGWELETVFVIIDNTAYPESNLTTELLYTAFTRAIKNLIIIEIGNGEYTSFLQKYFQNKQLDRERAEIKPLLEPI